MINSTNGSMDLIISEPIYLPKLSKTQPFISKLTNNYNRATECNHPEVKLRKRSNNTETLSVITIDKNINRLSPICDEQFPLTIPSDKPTKSSLPSSFQATRFARRHFHIYDWTRLSLYDNVPPPFDYLSEPVIIEDRSPTSVSSTDDKRSSFDRKDSGLGTSSIDKPADSIQLSTNLNRSISSSSSSSSSRSSYNSNVTCQTATRRIRVKWHSFTKTHRPSFNSSKYHLGQMSVGQLLALRRAALIRIQELFDTTRILSLNKTVQTRHHFLATAFTAVPKLIIRKHQQRKESHHEIKRLVFGVSLLSMTQRTGHPVPMTIISAMKYLRRTSIDSVGIFRKPGVSHRIKRLHDLIESNLEFHQFDDFSPYDVSDVLKQYFRLLPECLFTNKLSPLFLLIQEHFASSNKTNLAEERLLALQYAILLLPDENRLVLHLLLSFLSDVSQHSTSNQMSSINLATCFAPTLFSFHHSPKHPTHGMPDLREIQEQRKAMDILAFMIDHVRFLFLIPNELHQACHFSYIEIGEPCTLEELGRRISEPTARKPTISIDSLTPSSASSCEELLFNINNNNNRNVYVKRKTNASYQKFLDRCITEIVRESCSKKVKGWTSFGKLNQIELAFKKLDDGHPLGLWKCSMEIEAPPIEILNRLLNERNLWDDDFQSGNIVEQLNRHTHVYQYTINSMAPLASRYFCEVRSWRTNIRLHSDQRKETCALVCMSIEHPKGHCPSTSVRAVTLASRYLIQSNGCGKSKVTHLSRVDLMGRSQEWYTKVYGSMLTRSMIKLRDSFLHLNSGPETKV